MHFVYIIYSPTIDKYYIGQTTNIAKRLVWHNSDKNNNWTKRAADWILSISMECFDKNQAIKIEAHIKKMKSRKYFDNFKKYPEIREKLLDRYTPGSSR